MNIIRILPGVYNEADILEENLLYYIKQGIDTVVIDNGSTDNSYAICKKYVGKGIIKLLKYYSKDFDTMGLLKMATLQCHELNPDWVVMADVDEFIEPSHRFKNLIEAIIFEDKEGYNFIRQYNFIFKMTKKDNEKQKSILKRMKYYIRGDLDRCKIWKHSPYVIIKHPHQPEFLWKEDQRISPVIYALRHYPLRSLAQVKAKIKRVQPSEGTPLDWNMHYLQFLKGIAPENLYAKRKNLAEYREDARWNILKIAKEADISQRELSYYLLRRFNSYILERKIKSYPTWQKRPELIDLLLESYIHDKRFDLALAESESLLKNIKNIEHIIVKNKKKIKALIKK